MKIFNFVGYNKQQQQHIIGIDLDKNSYQKTFDCSTPEKADAALGVAIVESQKGKSVMIDLRSEDIDIETLTQWHLHTMGHMYNKILDIPADTTFKSSYLAYAKSACNPDAYHLSNQYICRDSGLFIDGSVDCVKDLAEAKLARSKFIEDNNLGVSTDLGGEVYKEGVFVGYLSYNGELWDNVFYGGQKGQVIEDFLCTKSN